MNIRRLLIIALFFMVIPFSAFSYTGIGYYCESYATDASYDAWSFKGCQKVIYNDNGFPIGVEQEKVNLNYVFCPSHISGPNGCDGRQDKKKFPTYYGYAGWSGAAMPEGLDFWQIYVLNDEKMSEGTKIAGITMCLQHTEYGLENCRKIN